MDNTYGEFQGTEFDPSLDSDFEEENDIVPILGLAVLLAAIVGGALVLLGRRRQPTVAERAQDVLEGATKEGKKGLKAAGKAVEDAKLGDLLEDALARANKVAGNGHLSDLLGEAKKKASDAAGRVDVGEVMSAARKGAMAGGVGVAALLHEALDRAKDASNRIDMAEVGDAAGKARKRAVKAVSQVKAGDVDGAKAGEFLDDFKQKLLEVIESVRTEVAPRAADVLKSDVMPAAQSAVEKLREDVLPTAQRRASHLAEEYEVAPRAQKAAAATVAGAGSLGGLLRMVGLSVLDKVMQDVLPQANKMGKKAYTTAREDVIPAAADTAGEVAHRVREDVLPKVGAAAAQTPDMLSDVLQMAREKVAEAIDRAQPVVADAAEIGKHGAGAVASGLHHRGQGVTGAVTSARKGVSGAVGGAVSATTYATRETTGILFWLSMLGAVVLLIFMPERDKQEEMWNNLRQFLGEVREMWRDLQGQDDFEVGSDTSTVN